MISTETLTTAWLHKVKMNPNVALMELREQYKKSPDLVNGILAALNQEEPAFVTKFYRSISTN